jgi:hypothetical protein
VKAGTLVVTTLVLASAAVWFGGCGGDHISSSAIHSPSLLSVSPPDGADEVAASTAITVQFDAPMDTKSVTANMYLTCGDDMHEWMDSFTGRGGMGGGHMMGMDDMIEWMHRIETPGDYHWNDAHDVCEFVPQGGLKPDVDYMLFIGEGMRSDNGGMMRTRHDGYDQYMYHFHTAH